MRWWEFYFIRYAMGTVVGAIVVYSICMSNESLRPFLLEVGALNAGKIDVSDAIRLDGTQVTVLAAYGLVFCYIASSPILVFHAGRFMLAPRPSKSGAVWLAASLIVALGVFIWVWLALPVLGSLERLCLSMGCFVATAIVSLELFVGVRTLRNTDKLYQFYGALAQRREKSIGGFTDSYRHLREHGNSFFIVLLEIVLGVTILTASQVGLSSKSAALLSASVVVIWILPAVLVWLIATLLEREFGKRG